MTAPDPVAPVITGASISPQSPAVGFEFTLTVEYTPGQSWTPNTTTITGTDNSNGLPAEASLTWYVPTPDPTEWDVTDDQGRTYTMVPGSDTGTQVQFTAVV